MNAVSTFPFYTLEGWDMELPSRSDLPLKGDTVIGNDVWIGDRVFIGTGARILGKVQIANDVVIGANAVVTRDILEPGTTWVGIPAHKTSDIGSASFLRLPKEDTFKQ